MAVESGSLAIPAFVAVVLVIAVAAVVIWYRRR